MRFNLIKAKDFAEKITRKAGKLLLANQSKTRIQKYKDRQDICTNVDLMVERMVIRAIEKEYPSHNILSEEKGPIDKGGEYTWIIDPLDGTKEYFRKIPMFNTTLSLWRGDEILLGLVYRPVEKDFFWTIKGKGAFCNEQKVSVSLEKELNQSFIYAYLPTYEPPIKSFEIIWKNLGNLVRKSYRLRGTSDWVTSLSRVASGRCEGFVNIARICDIWDVAAGILMVKEGGGMITDREGNPIVGKNIENGIVASNAKIHNQILEAINQ